MKLRIATILFGGVLALQAGPTFSTFDIQPVATPTIVGTFLGNERWTIAVSGLVNLDGPVGNPEGLVVTNPDGSLAAFPLLSCGPCWAPGYQYFVTAANTYPTVAGGDGINHFAGGGGNYDAFPGTHSAFAPEGKQTTDTTDPGALRLGSLAYTFAANPTATDWSLLGFGGNFVTPAGGGTLQMVVVDTFYENDTGFYRVSVTPTDSVPEPAAMWLAFSGFALLCLPRAYRRLSRRG